MTLDEVTHSPEGVSLATISGDPPLAKEIQDRLSLAGLLDPPSDGMFLSVSQWALREFCKAKGLTIDEIVTPAIATALQDNAIAQLFPLTSATGLAGKIVSAMQRKNYWIARHPQCFNIVYVEGMNSNGTPNDNAPNVFNDLRLLLQVQPSGTCKIVKSWEGTTEPGKYWTDHPMDGHPKGAARIAFGQYKAWNVGFHHPHKPTRHEALVQVANVVIYRDVHKHYKREGPTFPGVFAINQHWGYDAPKNDLKRTSAGCLVGRTKAGHREFMKAVKSDPRYKQNKGYRFMTAVFPAADIQ